MSSQSDSIFVALPSYDGKVSLDTVDRLYRCPKKATSPFTMRIGQSAGSLLPDVFNGLWASALNGYKAGEVTHFAMLHTDIVPDPFWLDTLYRILKEKKADIVSAVVPLKDNQGLTSTAIGDPDDRWKVLKRFTMHEIHNDLPATFSINDTEYKNHPLLINTGCWICDLSKTWTKLQCFNIHSRIVEDENGKLVVESTRSEDWELSRHVHAWKGKVYATREIGIYHQGNTFYGNQTVWGTAKTDPNTVPYTLAI